MVSVVHTLTEFEVHSAWNKALKRWLVNPAINYWMPRFVIVLFLKYCSKSQLMLEAFANPGSWRVMQSCYEKENISDWVDWLAVKNSSMAMALRNRKKMVVTNLTRLFEVERGSSISILGIGTGPAISILEAMGASPWTEVEAICVEQDETAVAHGEELKQKLALSERVHFIQADAVEALSTLKLTPQVIEMVGLLEYLQDRDVFHLVEDAFRILRPGGTLMINSIQPNHGVQHFLERVFGMRLIYRGEEALMGILEKCGWRTFRIEREPLGIYSLVMAEKEK